MVSHVVHLALNSVYSPPGTSGPCCFCLLSLDYRHELPSFLFLFLLKLASVLVFKSSYFSVIFLLSSCLPSSARLHCCFLDVCSSSICALSCRDDMPGRAVCPQHLLHFFLSFPLACEAPSGLQKSSDHPHCGINSLL